MGRPVAMRIGERFGRLVVVSRTESLVKGQTRWLCRCDCGAETEVYATHLRSGGTSSCGCAAAELHRKAVVTHGLSRTPTYVSWNGMMMRCTNPNDPSYDRYGGRGVVVCERWQNGDGTKTGFGCFIDDMGVRPEGLTLDRIDNTKGYSPENCRWASRKEQMNNRSVSRTITYNGETLPISDWCKRTGLKRAALHARVFIYGWPIGRALGFEP